MKTKQIDLEIERLKMLKNRNELTETGIELLDELTSVKKHLSKQFDISGVRLSLPDAENIDYLRGFIDGYGGEEPHGVMPDGFKDINEVWDKMYELKGNKA